MKNQKLHADQSGLKTNEDSRFACANCWGQQEYDEQYLPPNSPDIKSNRLFELTKPKAFVQRFVETYVSGIRIK